MKNTHTINTADGAEEVDADKMIAADASNPQDEENCDSCTI